MSNKTERKFLVYGLIFFPITIVVFVMFMGWTIFSHLVIVPLEILFNIKRVSNIYINKGKNLYNQIYDNEFYKNKFPPVWMWINYWLYSDTYIADYKKYKKRMLTKELKKVSALIKAENKVIPGNIEGLKLTNKQMKKDIKQAKNFDKEWKEN